MERIGLVLEGGGLRGAYTAGVLAWFIDHDIEFEIVIGISSGALLATPFIIKSKQLLYELGVEYASRKENVGWRPLIREGTPVGYKFLFDYIINQKLKVDMNPIREAPTHFEIGVYDLSTCETIWLSNQDMDDHWQFVKAACTLPLAGNPVKIKGVKYLDGGITTMIPIFRSEQDGCQRHVVVTTKDETFVRKPNHPLLQFILEILYIRYPKMRKDLRIRTDVYYQERAKVTNLVAQNKALQLLPSKNLGVKRFKADRSQLDALYELAYQDCNERKEEILSFVLRKPL